MMTLLVAALMWQEATPMPYLDGKCTFYAVRRMEEVARNRGIVPEPDIIGYVAMNRAGDLLRRVWIEYGGTVYGPYLVIDTAQRGAHYEAREAEGKVIEVSWEQAQVWGMKGPVQVRVHLQYPYPDPVRAI